MVALNDVEQYAYAWAKTQIVIWKEKIERMRIVRTGALHTSLEQNVSASGNVASIFLKYLRYGIYQAHGVGNHYEKGNPGDLRFLDRDYRREHRLDRPRKVGPEWGGYRTSGKPRVKRDWYAPKLYMSRMAMVEDLARILGENAASVVVDELHGQP